MRPPAALLLSAALLAPLGAALAPVPPLGEFPGDWHCNAEGEARRVCAGIAADGDATCAPTQTGARCAYQYGWISRAWSTEGESGSEAHTGWIHVTQCSSVSGCLTLTNLTIDAECAWISVHWCEDGAGPLTGETDFPLVMGECVRVLVTSDSRIDARVDGLLSPLAPAAPAFAGYHHWAEDGDAICLVDDGR